MSSSECIVAADVGNSKLKLRVRRTGTGDRDEGSSGDRSIASDHSIAIDGSAWQASAIAWVQQQLGCEKMHWRIASVDRIAAGELQQAIVSGQPGANIQQATRHDVPLKTRVTEPDRLGIDRLLGAFAASNRFPVPLIVVDAGSAVTVDYVSRESEFVGGAILPGLLLQTRSLTTGTAALPHVSCDSGAPLKTPGQNTWEAIRLGVLLGLAGAVDRLVASYCELPPRSSQKCQVVVTGGDAATLSPHLRFPHEIVPNLVCRGLLDLPRSSDRQTT